MLGLIGDLCWSLTPRVSCQAAVARCTNRGGQASPDHPPQPVEPGNRSPIVMGARTFGAAQLLTLGWPPEWLPHKLPATGKHTGVERNSYCRATVQHQVRDHRAQRPVGITTAGRQSREPHSPGPAQRGCSTIAVTNRPASRRRGWRPPKWRARPISRSSIPWGVPTRGWGCSLWRHYPLTRMEHQRPPMPAAAKVSGAHE